jgi:predicted nucleic acid-binding protein
LKYGKSCRSILEDAERSRLDGVISIQVIAEVSAVLYRQFGISDTTRHVAGMLSYRLRVQPVTTEIVRIAAEYSRDYHILPYDGIHVATAIALKAEKIASADRELDRVSKLIERMDPLEYVRK